MDAGANIGAQDKYKQTALALARDNDYQDIVVILKHAMDDLRRRQIQEQQSPEQPEQQSQWPRNEKPHRRQQQPQPQQRQHQPHPRRHRRERESTSTRTHGAGALVEAAPPSELDPQAMVKMIRMNVFRFGGIGVHE